MNHPDDDLRARLRRLDPAGDLPVDPVSSPRAASSVERAMQTLDTPAPRQSSRRRLVLAGGAALAAAAAVTTGLLLLDGDPGPGEPTALDLSLSEDAATASCFEFREEVLAQQPVALAGTVTTVGEDEVLLEVDRWFAGGDADLVRLEVPGGVTPEAAALWYGIDFRAGERYLVTARDGNVNSCGYTVPATPEMESVFERVFTD